MTGREVCYKKKVFVDVRVEADFSSGWYSRNPSEQAEYLKRRCKDFNEFIRDHRSQDDITLNCDEIYEEQCSICGTEWETDILQEESDDGFPAGVEFCLQCGAVVNTEETP